jgi:phosphoribosylformimino-5-aminoimidazole carboxamide ribotide isomerase
MQIWPAIDIRGGRCVRLQQGDYDRETVFDDNPVDVAQQWVHQGAECLHLVDLDGARDGQIVNRTVIAEVVSSVDVPCQLGGGIRDEASIKTLLDLGVRRLVLGTKAIEDADWFRRMAQNYPDQLVLGIDARNGSVATDGWLKTSETSAIELAKLFESEPIVAIVYTDIARDGMLKGPNFDAMAGMKSAVNCPVIASGGVATRDDVRQLAEVGMDGCIIGRALYEGRVSLRDALAAADPDGNEVRK